MSPEGNKKSCTAWDTHYSVKESQVHLGIQYGKCDHALQCEISEQYRAHYRGCEGSQLVTQGEKHARHFSCGAGCQQHDDD